MDGWVDHPTNHDRTSSFDSSFGSSGAVPAAAVFEADQGIDGYLPLAPDLGLGPRLGPPPPVRASTLNNPVGQPYAHSMHSGTHDGSMLERSAMPLGTGVRGQGDLGNHHDDGRVSSTARPGSSAADLSLSAFGVFNFGPKYPSSHAPCWRDYSLPDPRPILQGVDATAVILDRSLPTLQVST